MELLLLWGVLWCILRPCRRPGRGWCPACTAPDLWIVSRETPATLILGVSALILGGVASIVAGSTLASGLLAGAAALVARRLRPVLRRCESCGHQNASL